MKPYRTPALLLTGLLAVACSRQDDMAGTAANPLLAFVPADTPYVIANLEPTPADIVDAWLVRLQPLLEQAQLHLDAFQEDLQAAPSEIDPSFAALASAILAELDGKLNRAGLESLGISLESVNAIYGHGLFPVARIGLRDPLALRDTIARIEASSGMPIPEHQSGGRSYWKIENRNGGIAAFVSILDDHVAFGVAPLAAEMEFLPEFLGERMPDESLAGSGALLQLNRAKGFTPWGSGYLDVAGAVEELLVPSSRTAAWLNALGDYRPGDVPQACAAEARLMAGFTPRMVAGVTEMTADTVGMRYQLEIEPSLAGELADLVADVPPASRNPAYALTLSLGIRVGALREFLLEKFNAMAASPFQCPQLAHLNQQIMQAATSLNQPMPPFIGNLKGLRAALSELDAAKIDPMAMRGLMSLEVVSPQMVIGMASMMIPGFEELDIQPGNDPVRLPEELISVVTPETEIHAVMTSDAIGLSIGKGLQDELMDFMELEQDNDGAFLSVEYDMAAMAGVQSQQFEQWQTDSGEQNENLQAQAELVALYRDMLDRGRQEFRFTEEGLTIDNRMSFK